MRIASLFFGVGAASSAVAVALGALGAHALKARLAPDLLASFQTAVHYQILHSIALCIVALWLRDASNQGSAVAGWAFLVGIVCFSGSIYALVFGGPRWLGPVTPVGGLAFILGWSWLAWGAVRRALQP